MPEDPPALAYATATPLDAPGSAARIEQTQDALLITIPPQKLWYLLAGPVAGLLLAVVPLTVIASFMLSPFMWRNRTDVGVCTSIPAVVLLFLAGYNLNRLLRAARFGRRSIVISINRDRVLVDRGIDGSTPESLPITRSLVFYIEQTGPTMTLGRLVDMHFRSAEGRIDIHFYTRNWQLADTLRSTIVEQLRVAR